MANQIPYTPGYWTIPDVSYRGRILTVDLLDGLLPAMTQEQASAHAKANPNGFITRDLPMYFAIFRALEQQRTQLDVSAPVAFLRKSMQHNWLQTLTAIDYTPRGKLDIVTHGVGTEKPYSQEADVVGPDGQITQEDRACLAALLGTGDVKTINRVSAYINNTPAYLLRVNANPSEVDRCVVRFRSCADWVYLYCSRRPQDSDPALGVRRVAPLSGARKR